MRAVIFGGRTYGLIPPNTPDAQLWLVTIRARAERAYLTTFLSEFAGYRAISVVLEGEAKGADQLAAQWARRSGVKVEPYPADWKAYGVGAGPLRNQQMVDAGPDIGIAFPGAGGTADMTRRLKQAGIEVVQAVRR